MNSKVITGPVVESEIMSAKETAEYLKISYWLLMKMVSQSQIPAFRCGSNKTYFSLDKSESTFIMQSAMSVI